jgi:hypothetical protein
MIAANAASNGPASVLIALFGHNLWLEPALLIVHLCCAACVLGAVVVFDLRLCGFWRHRDIAELHAVLIPFALLFTLPAAASGALLFALHAAALVGFGPFVFKIMALFAAAINAMIFATGPYQSVATWPKQKAPAGAIVCAILSLVFLGTIAACGVLVASALSRQAV